MIHPYCFLLVGMYDYYLNVMYTYYKYYLYKGGSLHQCLCFCSKYPITYELQSKCVKPESKEHIILSLIFHYATSGNFFFGVLASDSWQSFGRMADDIESRVLRYKSRLQSCTDEEKVFSRSTFCVTIFCLKKVLITRAHHVIGLR